MKKVLAPPDVRPAGAYSLGWIVEPGPCVYLAGHVPLDEAGRTVGVGDPERQMHQVFTNLRATLASAAGSLDDIVKMTVFLTDVERDGETYRRVRGQYFTPPLPASTLVQVARLVRTEWIVEIEAVAALRGDGSSAR